MARKVFKTQEYILHLITSTSGVMIVKLIDKNTKEILEEKFFTEVCNELTDYVESTGFDLDKIVNYLNAN
jgi:uncharacterized FlaG/YvyC family protein